jgi:ectoine hydroxylase-related dioxygenase (phytanoyl-CoA dioxygenase family)
VHFNARPGDVIVHHLRSVHGSGAHRSETRTRRAIAIRSGRDDARYKLRSDAPPDGIEIAREDGQPLDRYAAECPRARP